MWIKALRRKLLVLVPTTPHYQAFPHNGEMLDKPLPTVINEDER
jgi:hypothetical protein